LFQPISVSYWWHAGLPALGLIVALGLSAELTWWRGCLLLAAIVAVIALLVRLRSSLLLEMSRDVLTGLQNRRGLHDFLCQISAAKKFRHSRRVSLLMMDIDRFKDINDAFGHPAADRLLLALVQAWQDCLRTTDRLARLGGDEFCAVIPDVSPDQATMIGERLRCAAASAGEAWRLLECHQRVSRGAGSKGSAWDGLQVHVSVGIVNASITTPERIGECMQLADDMLYAAKRLGGNATVSHCCV
jgi:diguanylate cyclase (GGDEF)-like protein